MRLKTEVGDEIETVRIIENGSHAGSRLTVLLTNEWACRLADQLIHEGYWRIREAAKDPLANEGIAV